MEVFRRRREKLMEQMGQGVAVLFGAKSAPAHGRFRQDSDFYYLTGIEKKNAVLVLLASEGRSLILLPPTDPKLEVWEGPMVTLDEALDLYGFDEAYPLNELDEKLRYVLRNQPSLYYTFGRKEEEDRKIHSILAALRREVREGTTVPKVFYDLRSMIHEMRLYKDPTEIACLRRSCEVAAEAHCEAIRSIRAGVREYEVLATLEYHFRRKGAFFNAFAPIVAGGRNALILHYETGTEELRDGDLVLLDAGCELEYYNSDISRTVPVNGQFTKEQREIYEVVLRAQEGVIAMIQPGVPYDALQAKAVEILTEGLVELGILEGDVEELIASRAYERFYMHKVGHWIGLDCHDVGEYRKGKQFRPLEPGMVLTVEPGLYIPYHKEVPEAYQGIGVRIEDVVLVTQEGFDVLTTGVPKRVEEIEELMQKQ